jgi:hypothetical protein
MGVATGGTPRCRSSAGKPRADRGPQGGGKVRATECIPGALTGLANVNFAVAIALVAFNPRIVRGDAELFDAGDGDLLLQEDEPCEGFLYLTSAEAAAILALRAGIGMEPLPEEPSTD